MSGRSQAVLGRFPCHLGLDDGHKRFADTVEGLTDVLDVVTRQVGDVRTAHRLAEASTRLDIERAGGLHAIPTVAFELVEVRHGALAGVDPGETAVIGGLTNLLPDDLDALDPDARAEAFERTRAWTSRRELVRHVVTSVVESHRIGNGTATSILAAAAGYLGFHLSGDVVHSDSRWWHFVPATDLLGERFELVAPRPDLFALEENPFRDASTTPAPRRHADRFSLRRGGLEDVTTSVVVVGMGARTVAPMVVNVDAGEGVVYDGTVADGAELVFDFRGQVLLDGLDVTGSAFHFVGGVFADADGQHPGDMVFADAETGTGTDDEDDEDDEATVATFVRTAPIPSGFDATPPLPHGGSVAGLPLAVGESRWSFFVRVAHYAAPDRPAVARNAAGFAEQSVFADAEGPPAAPSASVGFRWEEREPFAVRLYLPERLALLDDEEGTLLRQPLRALLDRHRAAGIHLRVSYSDPHWTVGAGITREVESSDALGTVVSGTTLWPDDTPQPSPN